MSDIHPDLRLDRLSRLPVHLRRSATAAASGSHGALLGVYAHMKTASEDTRQLYLPVLYAVLYPARIPLTDALEADTGRTSPAVKSVHHSMLALDTLRNLALPAGFFALFWPRMWKWMRLIMDHRYCLMDPVPSEDMLAGMFINSIACYCNQPETTNAAVISATPGVTSFAAHVWVCALAVGDTANLENITYFIRVESFPGDSLEEYIEAAGGTAHDLCSLVVRYVDYLASHPSALTTPFQFQAIALFTIGLSKIGLSLDLLDCGIARAITTLLGALSGPDVALSTRNEPTDLLLLILKAAAQDELAYKWIAQMLKAGFLTSIVLLANRTPVSTYLQDFLCNYLPKALVNYAVVVRTEAALDALASLPSPRSITDPSSVIFANWHAFIELAEERIALKYAYRSPESISLRACDNIKCGVLLPKRRFRRCTGCRLRVYCSGECQASDWQHAGHREACPDLRSAPDPLAAKAQERGFLLAIAHNLYEAQKFGILTHQVEFMVEHPTTEFITILDVSEPAAMCIKLGGIEPRGKYQMPGRAGSAWTEYMARVRGSGGRMEIHLLETAKGLWPRSRIMPLWSSSNAISEGLRKIADVVRADKEAPGRSTFVAAAVTRLLSETADVVRVYCEH